MDNPKIVIMSDGITTELFVDGEKVNMATMADFHFHAEPMQADFEYEKYVLNEDRMPKVNNNELVTEKQRIHFGSD